ncbi:hypothetical protein CL632_00600 [bacterium]|jgi:aromatic ring-opening dioxygenase LigB subunit|nr:hypothetical protein [bacterium]MDP6756251.1 MEMO1 family protein [Patescibacteria group bacterium]|tara:strand:- start:14584 stop:15351 length:768 start_codon:yes stop_codon:yes gene_type:complete
MLSYVAHIPHSPLLLPQISRHRFKNFKKMHESVKSIASDIYAKKCNTILLLTPYNNRLPSHYLLNVSPKHSAKFENFGDFRTKEEFSGDLELAYRIRHALCTEYDILSITEPDLDTASGAAMIQIESNGAKYNILPFSYAQQSSDSLHKFGSKLRSVIERADNKVAVVSLGDLSRSNMANLQNARELDEKLLKYLNDKDTLSFFKLGSAQINSFHISGARTLALVLGLLDKMNYKADILNYEQKHGVGMMAARFI